MVLRNTESESESESAIIYDTDLCVFHVVCLSCCRRAISNSNQEANDLLHPTHADIAYKRREIRHTIDWAVSTLYTYIYIYIYIYVLYMYILHLAFYYSCIISSTFVTVLNTIDQSMFNIKRQCLVFTSLILYHFIVLG